MNLFRDLQRRFMLSCEDVNHFLVRYLEDDLEPRTAKRFERHVARCPQCRAYLEQYRTTIDLVREERTLALEEVPDELVEMTLAFLRKNYEDGEDGPEART